MNRSEKEQLGTYPTGSEAETSRKSKSMIVQSVVEAGNARVKPFKSIVWHDGECAADGDPNTEFTGEHEPRLIVFKRASILAINGDISAADTATDIGRQPAQLRHHRKIIICTEGALDHINAEHIVAAIAKFRRLVGNFRFSAEGSNSVTDLTANQETGVIIDEIFTAVQKLRAADNAYIYTGP